MSYYPKVNSVAWRAMQYLESLDIGAEITTGALGVALDVPSGSLQACLEGPLNNGILFRRQKDISSPRSPVFWSLTDYSEGQKTPPLSSRSVFDLGAATKSEAPAPVAKAVDLVPLIEKAASLDAEIERVAPPAPIWPEHRVLVEPPKIDEPIAPDHITADEIAAIVAAPRFALWSDGKLQIESGAGRIELAREETKALIDYLDVMHGRKVAA